jgi:hypothetical protein
VVDSMADGSRFVEELHSVTFACIMFGYVLEQIISHETNSMGRPSKLTKEQWMLVEHRHVVDGVPLDTLAAEYSISATALRRKIKPSLAERARGVATLRGLAEEKVEALAAIQTVDSKIAELPETRQIIVNDLVARIQSISVHLSCAAETNASTARKLALLAGAQVDKVKLGRPIDDIARKHISDANFLAKSATEAGALGMGLLSANRDHMRAPPPEAPGGVNDLTDAELDAELLKHGIDPATV